MPFKKPTFNVNIQPQFGSRPRALQQRNAAAGLQQPAAISLTLSPTSGTRGGPAPSPEQVSGTGRHRRAPGKGLWQANFIVQEFLCCTESFCAARRVSFPGALAELAADGSKEPPQSPRSKQPHAIQSCSLSHPVMLNLLQTPHHAPSRTPTAS